MNHKVFRSVFVLAIAIGLASVVNRVSDAPKKPLPTVRTPEAVSPESRGLASYRVNVTPTETGADYVGASYNAQVTPKGFTFGRVPETGSRIANREFTMEFGSPRIEQGSVKLECSEGTVVRPSTAVARIERGAVTEEYVFENRRVEQVFHFAAPLAQGAPLSIFIPVKTDLTGPVVAHEPQANAFIDIIFRNGGLSFSDVNGVSRMSYHSAVAIDAVGHRVPLMPRYANNQIVLEVPAAFMDGATYPIMVDPWLDLPNISANGGASEKPSISKIGGRFAIAWSDNSTGNYEVYVKISNGVDLIGLAGSDAGGGISNNPGRSVNPSIVVDGAGNPAVAWEDDSSGFTCVFCKQLPAKGRPGAGSWTDLAGSSSGTGVSGTGGPSLHPSIGLLNSVIPGIITTNPSTGAVTSTPPVFLSVPVIVWDEENGQIYCKAFYPGQPAHPADPAVPAFPQGQAQVPEGWYQLGLFNGVGINKDLFFPQATVNLIGVNGGVQQYPTLMVDNQNRVCVAFQSTENGNYDIHFRRFTYTAAPGSTNFFVQSAVNLQSFNQQPPGNFLDISGANGFGTVLATPTPSQHPSLGIDPTVGTIAVAWEETESTIPATGTSSQIYVAIDNGGGFGPVGGSLSAGGISQTLNRATYPSLDALGGSIAVAWADDSNGRSSVYLRMLDQFGAGTWDQVGFQGSAFPPAFIGEVSPIDGVSKSSNYALQPQVNISRPTVIWADGSASTFDILGKSFSPNAPGIASGVGTAAPTFALSVQQTATDPRLGGAAPVTVGGFSVGTTVWLSARVFTENPPSNTLRLEYEIHPAGALFTGTPTHQSLFVPPDTVAAPALGNLAVLKFDGLPNFNYHWIARTIDEVGQHSPWVSPGETGGVSFRINAAAPPGGNNGPPNTTTPNNGGTSKSKCGLTGLEAIALLGALRLLRRRRSK